MSDSWKLGEINACFPVSYREEIGDGFLLGRDRLSEQLWNFKYEPILERFSVTYRYEAKNFTDQKIIQSNLTEYHVSCKNDLNSKQNDPIHELENYVAVFYPGVLTWHKHRYLNRSWKYTQPISLIC
ncbi:MAG: hypothetical protein PG981_000895 [Wolbachia endosymbiont of Ctenocephalides orientis wCori]|nr:MAG: hypothetical protein PG981_000895 [Wolbachia endosymbiont of Ctenocephalides orientis wCori]